MHHLIVQHATMLLPCVHVIVSYAQSLSLRRAQEHPPDELPVGQQLGHAEANKLSVFVIIVVLYRR